MGFQFDRSPNDPKAAITWGRDYNFFQKATISATSFQTDCDMVITFPTSSVIMTNLSLGTVGTSVIEYSLNGNTLHGEIYPSNLSVTGLVNTGLVFDNRVISKIWFRVQSGSSGTLVISVQAWGIR